MVELRGRVARRDGNDLQHKSEADSAAIDPIVPVSGVGQSWGVGARDVEPDAVTGLEDPAGAVDLDLELVHGRAPAATGR